MSKGSNRRPGKGYETSKFAQTSKVKGGSWVQCPKTGKLIPKEEFNRQESDAPYVQGDIEPFISPVTQEVISDRGQLRRHNKEHGVTNSADYSPEFLARRSKKRLDEAQGKTHRAKRERIQALSYALDKAGIR